MGSGNRGVWELGNGNVMFNDGGGVNVLDLATSNVTEVIAGVSGRFVAPYSGGTGPGPPYCFGDGSGTACPCGNNNEGSLAEAGCAKGQCASDARLTASGKAGISADTLVLQGEHTENNQSGLYFQADNDLSPGLLWGDGLQCAGGSLKRLGVRFSDSTGYSDTSGYPLPISVKAGNVLAGQTKYYQCWYRSQQNSPCGAEFNASNGFAVLWLP